MHTRLITLCLLLFSGFIPAKAQPFSAETERLHQLFKEFRYQEVIQEAEKTLDERQDLTIPDKCEILRLLALSYYSRQDMQGALKNFSGILALDEHYHLDPIKNSPKILAFFEEIRRQRHIAESSAPPQPTDSLETSGIRLPDDTSKQISVEQTAFSLILPGYGQVQRGERTKGWLLLAGNFALLGSAIYFTAETNRLEDRYLQITNPDQISGAWENYNRAYKSRNLFISAFAVLWLYTQIDFFFHRPPVDGSRAISCYPVINTDGKAIVAIEVPF